MKKSFTSFLIGCFVGSAAMAQEVINDQSYDVTDLTYTQLADMNYTHMAMQIFWSGNDIVVNGGHSSGFITSAESEIYANGVWTKLEDSHSTHDNGSWVTLPDGRTIIAGGHNGSWGTGGGTSVAEMYTPATRTFTQLPDLNDGRAIFNGVLVGDRAYFVGDYWQQYWYGEPASIEYWNGESFTKLDTKLSFSTISPYLMPKSDNSGFLVVYHNISGATSTYNADRVSVADNSVTPISIPLLSEWIPIAPYSYVNENTNGAGNGRYVITCLSSTDNNVCAVVMVDADEETAEVITVLPSSFVGKNGETLKGGPCGDIMVDRNAQNAYVIYMDKKDEGCMYSIVTIDLQKRAISEVSYAMLPTSAYDGGFLMMPDGKIFVAGGSDSSSNFDATNKSYLITPCQGIVLGISNAQKTRLTTAKERVYNVGGQVVGQHGRGLNIIRHADGTVTKKMVR